MLKIGLSHFTMIRPSPGVKLPLFLQVAMPMVLSTAERPHASAFAAALLPPLEGHPSMEDVFSPADLIGPRPQQSFTGQQRRPWTDQQRLPPPGSRGRCGCHPVSYI